MGAPGTGSEKEAKAASQGQIPIKAFHLEQAYAAV